MQVAPLALVPELAPSKQMKVELNSIRFAINYVRSNIIIDNNYYVI